MDSGRQKVVQKGRLVCVTPLCRHLISVWGVGCMEVKPGRDLLGRRVGDVASVERITSAEGGRGTRRKGERAVNDGRKMGWRMDGWAEKHVPPGR